MNGTEWETRDRIIYRNNVPVMRVSRWQDTSANGGGHNIAPHEMDELIRRMVHLLNEEGN